MNAEVAIACAAPTYSKVDSKFQKTDGATTAKWLPRLNFLAEWTGLEPATPGVTGRYSNQLNYHSWWRPYGDSNPGTHRERVMS